MAGVASQRCTEEQVQDLAAVNGEIGKLIDDPDPAARAHGYRVLNRRFHGIIHDMARTAVVVGLSRRMWDLSDLLINTSGVPQPLASSLPQRHADHELIISALRNRDQAAADNGPVLEGVHPVDFALEVAAALCDARGSHRQRWERGEPGAFELVDSGGEGKADDAGLLKEAGLERDRVHHELARRPDVEVGVHSRGRR